MMKGNKTNNHHTFDYMAFLWVASELVVLFAQLAVLLTAALVLGWERRGSEEGWRLVETIRTTG